MPGRTKGKTRPKRKTRKGGDYGIRMFKTWKNNYTNCLKYPGMNSEYCKDTMSQFDYHKVGREPWATDNRKSAKAMYRERPGGFDIINPLVTVAPGDTFRVQ